MKTRNYVAGLIMLFALAGGMNAQNFDHGEHVYADVYNDIARDIAVINNSLEYKITVGSYQPTSAAGTYNGFVWVTDDDDNPIWYITVEGNGNDEVNGVDARAKTVGGLSYGDIYFTGYFTGTVTMVLHYGFPLHHFTTTIHTHAAPGGTNDCTYFVTKVDQDGAHVWTYISGTMGETNTEIGNDVAVSVVSSVVQVYTTGFFRGTTSFNPAGTPTSVSAASWNSIFTAKYVDNGATATYNWVSLVNDNTNNQHDYGYGVVGDGSGNIYMCGSIGATSTVGSSTLTVTGNDDAIVVKYNSSGTPLWSMNFGGNGSVGTPSDQARGIAYLSGNIYVCGYYSGSGTFTNWSATAREAFFAKIYDNTTSGSFVEKNTIISAGTTVAYHLCISPGGDFYVVGTMDDDATIKDVSGATIWPSVITSISNGTNSDGFMIWFNSAADDVNDAQWISSDDGADVATGVAALSNANIYVVGTFMGYYLYDVTANVYIDNISTNPPTVRDAYIAHYDSGLRRAAPTQITAAPHTEADIYPNPTSGKFLIRAKNDVATTVEILDMTGRSVRSPQLMKDRQIEIDLSDFSAGVYFARLIAGEAVEMVRVVKE